MISDASPIVAEDLEIVALAPQTRRRLAPSALATVTVDFLGTAVAVSFENEQAAARYAKRYGRFRSERAPQVTAFAVSDAASTYFWYSDRPAFRWPRADLTPASIDFLADSVVRREYFSATSHLTFHAAAVEVERGAVAIVAPSTGGKTTTSIACARRGLRLFTDEECITKDGWVHPFPRAINLRADGIDRILADPSFEDGGIRDRLLAHRGEAWNCATFDDLFGAFAVPQARPLVAMYFIGAYAPAPAIEPLARAKALSLFLTAWPRSKRGGIDRVADILELFSAAPPYALTLGTPDATARAIATAGRA